MFFMVFYEEATLSFAICCCLSICHLYAACYTKAGGVLTAFMEKSRNAAG